MKVLFIDSTHPILQERLEEAGFKCEKDFNSGKEEIASIIAKYDGIVIRSRFRIDKDFLSKAKKLKFIARSGAGMENIDLVYAEAKGIQCFNAPEGNRDAVAEHAIGMLLSLMNNLIKSDQEVRQQKWDREGNRGYELGGRTVGIIGYGNMGSAFAKRLKGFGCSILAYDKYKKGFGNEMVQEVDLETIFKETEILSIHLPLTDETLHYVDNTFISQFKKPFWLINTARGQHIKTSDLLNSLEKEKIRGACLDVLEAEKSSFERVDLSNDEALKALLSNDKIIFSPHIAGWTFESYKKLSSILADKILATFG